MDAMRIHSHFVQENIPVISVGYVRNNYYLVTLDMPDVHAEAVLYTSIWRNWKREFTKKIDKMGYSIVMYSFINTIFGVYVVPKVEE